jgi:hypothetical protein
MKSAPSIRRTFIVGDDGAWRRSLEPVRSGQQHDERVQRHPVGYGTAPPVPVRAYAEGLRRLNKEVYLFNYNGEPHNLRRRPNQKDYTRRMQEFFDHVLKGAPKPGWMESGIPFIQKGK